MVFPFLLSSKDLFGAQKMLFSLLFYLSGIVFPIPIKYEAYMVLNPFYYFINLSKTALNQVVISDYPTCAIYLSTSILFYFLLKNKYKAVNQKITEIL